MITWWTHLPPHDRLRWLAPAAIISHCPVSPNNRQPGERRQTTTQANAALHAELTSTQDHLADARKRYEDADARVVELEEELANARAETGSGEADLATSMQRSYRWLCSSGARRAGGF